MTLINIDKSQLGLHAVHVETCEGLIFVSLATTPPAFEPARRLMAPFARPQGFERARVAGIVDYEIRANWKLVWENNRECYHCSVSVPRPTIPGRCRARGNTTSMLSCAGTCTS